MAYKGSYTLGEFWGEMTQSAMYRDYARKNPVESSAIAGHVAKKIAGEADFVPVGLARTHFGAALVFAMITLPVQ